MVPLLYRKVPADGPGLHNCAEADPELHNLYITSGDTAAIVYIESDGMGTMHAGLSLKKKSGAVSKVLTKNSSTEFFLGMADKIVLDNYVTLFSCRNAANEPFGMKGEFLVVEDL